MVRVRPGLRVGFEALVGNSTEDATTTRYDRGPPAVGPSREGRPILLAKGALDRSLAQEAINTESSTAFQPHMIENLAVAELIGMSRPDRVGTPARFTNNIGALVADRRPDNLFTYGILLSGDSAGRNSQRREAVPSLLMFSGRCRRSDSGYRRATRSNKELLLSA